MGCTAFVKVYPDAPSCCASCHDDADYEGFDFFDYKVGGQTYYLCCALSNWAREAKLLARD